MTRLTDVRRAALLRTTGSSPRSLRCRGVTGVIRDRYFPDYTFTGNTRGGSGNNTDVWDEQSGMSRGRRVDSEVQKWINDVVRVRAAKSKATTLPPRKKIHMFTRAFIALMKKLHLRPMGAQVVVRCEKCNIATLVDAVFLNQEGRIVLVELKCGFEGYIDRSSGEMKGVFKKISNAPKNQHQIQLAFTRCMFERTFSELGSVDALVVRMTSTGAHVSKVSAEIDRTSRTIFGKNKHI